MSGHRDLVFKSREEFLKRKVIDGISASAILGENPDISKKELYNKLVYSHNINEISQVDNESKDLISQLFAIEHKQYEVIFPRKDIIYACQHKRYEFLVGFLDGELLNIETQEKGLLIIKTETVYSSDKENNKSNIPKNYYIEALHDMLVDGAYKFAIIYCRKRNINNDGSVYITEIEYVIKREDVEKDLDYLLEQEIDFWDNHVRKNIRTLLQTYKIINRIKE